MRYKPLPFVQLHTSVLGDDDFLDLSPVAKTLAFMSMARAGADLSDGVLRDSARSMARYSGLTLEEAEAARDELLEMGFFVRENGKLRIRNWLRYQTPADQWKAQQDDGRLNAHKRWHTQVKAGCEYCFPSNGDPIGKPSKEPTEAPTGDPNAKEKKENKSLPSATDLRDDLLSGLNTLLAKASGPDEIEKILIAGLEAADEQAAAFEGKTKSKDLRSFLRQAVGYRAVELLWEDTSAANRVKQLVALHGEPALRAIIGAVGMSEPVGYVINQLKGVKA